MALSTIDQTGTTGVITSGTAVASTSGTSINYTGIPSWVKRITVLFNGVSLSGTSNLVIQAGSGSVQTTGYDSTWAYISGASATCGSYTSGVYVQAGAVAYTVNAKIELVLLGGNIWVVGGTFGNTTTTVYLGYVTSKFTLSGTLDRVRITTVNGTDTFDAGSINILYE